MKIKSNNILSTLIAALMYLLFREEQKENKSNPCASMPVGKCIVIDEFTINSLYEGEWIILGNKHMNLFHSKLEPYCRNIAVFSMDSPKKAELAAKLGITNFEKPLLLENGKVIERNKTFKIKEYVSFSEILDLYIYCWAIDIRKILCSANELSIIIDKFMALTLKMAFEITGFYISK